MGGGGGKVGWRHNMRVRGGGRDGEGGWGGGGKVGCRHNMRVRGGGRDGEGGWGGGEGR